MAKFFMNELERRKMRKKRDRKMRKKRRERKMRKVSQSSSLMEEEEVVVSSQSSLFMVYGTTAFPESESLMETLPGDLVCNIFLRFPLNALGGYLQVSKRWHNLLKHMVFNDAEYGWKQLQKSIEVNPEGAAGYLMLIKRGRTRESNLRLYLAEHQEGTELFQVSRVSSPYWPSPSSAQSMRYNKIVGSIHGLLCLSKRVSQNNTVDYDPIFLYNPLLNEYLNLPAIINYSHHQPSPTTTTTTTTTTNLVQGFGFYTTTTNVRKYKVVRIYYRVPEEGEVETYTLGDEVGWRRSAETTPYQLQSSRKSSGVFLGGSLYWLIMRPQMMIISFNLDTEGFGVLQLPPELPVPDADTTTRLNDFGGGKLALTQENVGGHIGFWILVNFDEGNWITRQLELDVMDAEFYLYSPFYFRNEDMEEVLLACSTLEREEVLGFIRFSDADLDEQHELVEVLRMNGRRVEDVVPHIKSVVSLRSLGENGSRMMELGEDMMEAE